ncbi:hypothetical protein [Tumebacillus avium]|uniref:hypothetical protein n=1 Tax=Tumebacillus avium TaxID=1903704 RepID=UPI0012FD8E24|nr:hypothetical protein [Tumebacillus avium]
MKKWMAMVALSAFFGGIFMSSSSVVAVEEGGDPMASTLVAVEKGGDPMSQKYFQI